MEEPSQSRGTRWHRLMGTLFEELLSPTGVSVFTDFPVMAESPEADILLLRKEPGKWTAEQAAFLPDGIRDSSAAHILIEFKYTESVTEDTFRQTTGYEFFYRHAHKLRECDIQFFVMSAKTPQETLLRRFGYSSGEKQGIYLSDNPILRIFPLLCLNELSKEMHNAFVKCFASRRQEKTVAFNAIMQEWIKKLNPELQRFIDGLLCYWFSEKGEHMETLELTPEKVKEMGKMWADMVLSGMSVDDVLARFSPDDVLSRYKPEEVLSRYKPEEVLSLYNPEERLKGIGTEERLKGLEPEERLKGLEPEERLKGLGLKERLKGLSEAEIEEYLREIRNSRH